MNTNVDQLQREWSLLRPHVIWYGLQSLTKAERNYHHSGKLEFLALKWAACEHYRDYLYCAPHFVIYTDSNHLTYVLCQTKCFCSSLGIRSCRFFIYHKVKSQTFKQGRRCTIKNASGYCLLWKVVYWKHVSSWYHGSACWTKGTKAWINNLGVCSESWY